MSYNTTVESIIDSVIQDSQVQTTNRTALLDYVNRVSMRMLRESQWRFLRSQPQSFLTQPDVVNYWIGPQGYAPSGCVDTSLNLSDVYAVLPESVFDLTNNRQLLQDSTNALVGYNFRLPDSSYRSAAPKAFKYDFNLPNVLSIIPPADNNNEYLPVPYTPVCSSVYGGTVNSAREYYIVATFVDSAGGESTACSNPANVYVPPNWLLTAECFPAPVPAANGIYYYAYNIYVGSTISGPFYQGNVTPIPIGVPWIEASTGVFNNQSAPQAILTSGVSGQTFELGVNTSGQIVTLVNNALSYAAPLHLKDSSNTTWLITVNSVGQIVATVQPSIIAVSTVSLTDTSGINWLVGITTSGHLTTAATGSYPASDLQPPTSSTIQSLNGYVISFSYQKNKIPITSSSQTLQIPDQYVDVLTSGVNYFVNLYTSKPDDINIKAGIWKREFMEGLAQMRRDLRINFRNTDVIGPDPSTQYLIGTEAGYTYYAV